MLLFNYHNGLLKTKTRPRLSAAFLCNEDNERCELNLFFIKSNMLTVKYAMKTIYCYLKVALFHAKRQLYLQRAFIDPLKSYYEMYDRV